MYVCVRERDRECVFKRESVCMFVWTETVLDQPPVYVCVRERETERDRECVCA